MINMAYPKRYLTITHRGNRGWIYSQPMNEQVTGCLQTQGNVGLCLQRVTVKLLPPHPTGLSDYTLRNTVDQVSLEG